VDCSIIIPVRNEHPNEVFTCDSIMRDCADSYIDYEIILVFNGNTDKGIEYMRKKERKSLRVIEIDAVGQCQARQRGAELANSDNLLFFDSHVLMDRGCIKPILNILTKQYKSKIGCVFFPVRYCLDLKGKLYGYKKRQDTFTGKWTFEKRFNEPYRMPIGGAGAFAVKKKTVFDIGGYNKNLGVYGGGEPYLFFKSEMLGYTNIMGVDTISSVDICVSHYGGPRGYSWDNLGLHTNFLLAAFVLGGKDFSDKYFSMYIEKCKGNKSYIAKTTDAYTNIMKLSEEDREFVKSKAILTIDDVIHCDEAGRFDSWVVI
jgi:glycosyltransferase involved in cell wall biosynthesis